MVLLVVIVVAAMMFVIQLGFVKLMWPLYMLIDIGIGDGVFVRD